jgi:hypothetical protein
MSYKVECPYCSAEIELDTDDGNLLSDNDIDIIECDRCLQIVEVTSSLRISHDAEKFDDEKVKDYIEYYYKKDKSLQEKYATLNDLLDTCFEFFCLNENKEALSCIAPFRYRLKKIKEA